MESSLTHDSKKIAARELVTEANPFADDHELRPHIRSLIVDARYQIRGGNRLDRTQVRRYADAMAAGQKFPPVQAWLVDGALFLIDGFHRVAAAKFAGCEDGLGVEVRGAGSFEEGRWLAFEANRQHGLPIKTRAMREGFKAYVRAKKHLAVAGRYPKSYREMGKDLGIGHTTIRYWMKRFFPRVFRVMQSGEEGDPFANRGEAGGPLVPPDAVPMTPLELLEQAMAWAAGRPKDAGMNAELLAKAERFVEELRGRPLGLRF